MTHSQIQNTAPGTTHAEEITIPAGQNYEWEFSGDPNSGFRFIQGLTAHVNSDQEVTFWFAWGRLAADYGYLGDVGTCLANGSEGIIQYVSGVPNKSKFVIHNGTGSTANVSKIVGYFG